MNGQRIARNPARIAIALAVTCLIASMLLYPGGNLLDASAPNYSLAYNFLSDLGAASALNSEPNRAGAVLMGAAMILGVLALGGTLVGTVRVLLQSPRARVFALLAIVAGTLVCAGYLAVAVAPIDRAGRLHQVASIVAVHSFVAATALLSFATHRDDRFRTRATGGWAALTLVLAGFIAVAWFGPDVSTAGGLMMRVISQKIMAATALAVLWIESGEVKRARSGIPANGGAGK